jgi:sugar lactone lactonase YvrE
MCRSIVLLATLLALTIAARSQAPSPAPSTILQPSGVAFDAAGNLYFADASRNQVYESTLAGTLVLIAGNGTQGFAGDGASATAAELNQPQSVAIDAAGTLYIADTGNQRIRSVAGGIITTFAGTGVATYAGDNGPATAAAFHTPTALAIDPAGALLICDTGNDRVRRIAAGIVTTIAGNGSQGFSGDGAAATAAQLDSPSGIAAAPDGRILFADTHNDRIRLISTAGTITTFAGTGTRGYAGDNGPAASARLALPRGLTLTSAGSLLFADSNNQRIRQIDPQEIITTLAGNGVQGSAPDATPGATASLNNPRSVAISSFGAPTFTDAPAHTLHELVTAANLYRPAGLTSPSRASTVNLLVTNAAYGQTSASVTVSGVAGTPQGTVQILQGPTIIASAQLKSGSATVPLSTLTNGSYTLTAAYAGDGINPSATSPPQIITIGQAVATATANPATTTWSQPIPPLTGTLTGILPQDAANVSIQFSTSATTLSPPGSYSITASLSGLASSQYKLVLSSSSGSLHILQAPTITATQPLAQSSFAGLPLILVANVGSSATVPSVPTGSVTFLDNAAPIATAPLNAGVATTVFLSPSAGTHSIVASYSGDTDFAPSVAAAVTTSVGAMPDFTLASSGSSTQTVVAGAVATYNLILAAQPSPFTGIVNFTVSGLPANATATFNPTQAVPGSTSTGVVLVIQTPVVKAKFNSVQQQSRPYILFADLILPSLLVVFWKRKKLPLSLLFLSIALVFSLSGCGDRTTPVGSLSVTSYNLIVTGTSTNLAGAQVIHSVHLVLQVE